MQNNTSRDRSGSHNNENMKTIAFKISGLCCPEEVESLRKKLEHRVGICEVKCNILQAKIIITFDPSKLSSNRVHGWFKEMGIKVLPWEESKKKSRDKNWIEYGRLIVTFISGSLLLIALFFYLHDKKVAEYLCFLSTAFMLCLVLPRAYRAIRRLRFDMNLLITFATIGAISIGAWFEGAMVVFLFSLSLWLEYWSIRRARHAIAALMSLAPETAYVIEEGEKRVEEIEVGERILVRPGEKVPLDAIIEQGYTSINQAPITGESLPVVKREGEEVYAGTINGEGSIKCRVIKKADHSTMAQIICLVQEAQSRRANAQQWVEKFARIYTPIMVGFSLLIMMVPPFLSLGSWNEWLYRGLVVLMIACPCALVISTPISIISGLIVAARKGVLIKGGVFLEVPGRIRALALDKTGTLTYGRPQIQKIWPLNHHTEEELLQRAAALEMSSNHPLAYAILEKAKERGIEVDEVENFRLIEGKGAEGTYRGVCYWIGSHRFMHEMRQETEEIHRIALSLEDVGHSIIAIGNHKHVCGLISVADEPREDLASIIQEIKDVGVKKLVVLTGDNAQTARAIAKHAKIDEARAQLLPQDKANIVEQLKVEWGEVAMIGDGINDLPAMASASLGIAMGAMGADVAIETADIALMSDDLAKIPWLIRHSRYTLRIIKQNVGISLGVKGVFLGLAISGIASLWMVIAADTGALLIVVFNGLRLIRSHSFINIFFKEMVHLGKLIGKWCYSFR